MENSNTTEMMKSLEASYLKKDYKAAIDSLIANKELLQSGIFHYNLGTLYAKSGNFPAARYQFEKSIEEGFQRKEVYKNLDFVIQKQNLDDLSASNSFVDKTIALQYRWSNSLFISISLCLVIFALLKMKKNGLKTIAPYLFLLLAILPLAWNWGVLKQSKMGIVLIKTEVREGPSKIFEVNKDLEPGMQIVLGEIQNNWVHIIRPEHLAGWADLNAIGVYR